MNTWDIEIFGYVAAVLTTFSFLPQAIKTIREKRTRDLSLTMYILTSGGVLFWLIYGSMLGSLPMVLANSLTLALTLTILWLKLKHK